MDAALNHLWFPESHRFIRSGMPLFVTCRPLDQLLATRSDRLLRRFERVPTFDLCLPFRFSLVLFGRFVFSFFLSVESIE